MRQQALAGHRALDVSGLPEQGAFGPAGLIWWGTVGYMVIEGSMFVMVLITYFYLRLNARTCMPIRFRKARIWVGLRRMPVSCSIVACASATVRGGCVRKCASSVD